MSGGVGEFRASMANRADPEPARAVDVLITLRVAQAGARPIHENDWRPRASHDCVRVHDSTLVAFAL
jgi:hypothetical protein